jgi:hypothetical protein
MKKGEECSIINDQQSMINDRVEKASGMDRYAVWVLFGSHQVGIIQRCPSHEGLYKVSIISL